MCVLLLSSSGAVATRANSARFRYHHWGQQRIALERGHAEAMSGTAWFAIFLLLAVAGLAGMFLYGWRRRKDKMPKVAPLKDEDD